MTTTQQQVDSIGLARLRLCRDLEAEIPTLWAVQDAARVADAEIERNSLAGFATYYRHLERCNPTRDLIVAEIDGTVVGYARVEWNDTNDGERWYDGMGNVHPDWRRRGIGTQLLVWTEARRAEIADEHEAAGEATDRVRAFTTFVLDGDRGGAVLLERSGYTAFRWFASMRRPDLDDLPEVELPEGFDIRPIARDQVAMRQVFDADVEAFRDHFGWTEGSDEKFAEFLENPEVDTSLWLVAFAGAEVAGAVLNGIHVNADGEASGWLDSVFTRGPWRKKGLARALIAQSLVLLRERGLTAASLGVDLANANQALALYESCGFRTISGATAYRKPLPAPTADRLEEASR